MRDLAASWEPPVTGKRTVTGHTHHRFTQCRGAAHRRGLPLPEHPIGATTGGRAAPWAAGGATTPRAQPPWPRSKPCSSGPRLGSAPGSGTSRPRLRLHRHMAYRHRTCSRGCDSRCPSAGAAPDNRRSGRLPSPAPSTTARSPAPDSPWWSGSSAPLSRSCTSLTGVATLMDAAGPVAVFDRQTDVSSTLTMRTRAPRWIGDRDTGRCSPWLVPKIEGGEQPVGLAD